MSTSACINEFNSLQGRHDLAGLRVALLALCGKFGTVRNLTIFPVNPVGQSQALCFARMVDSDDEQRLAAALGIGRFAGEMVIVVNLRSTWAPKISDKIISDKISDDRLAFGAYAAGLVAAAPASGYRSSNRSSALSDS